MDLRSQLGGVSLAAATLQSSNIFERAASWLLRSGIQEPSGGVARYYLLDEQKNLPISTEITGYFVSSLLHLYHSERKQEYLDAARRGVRFLVCEAWNPQLRVFPYEWSGMTGVPELSYFFDCGIIVRGLLAYWRATGDERALEVAANCGRSMAEDFVSRETIHPVVALPQKAALPENGRWSRSPGCYQLKAALAWLELSEATGHAYFQRLYQEALAQALASRVTFLSGSMPPEKIVDRLHAYCYFLEGLLGYLQSADARHALREGILLVREMIDQTSALFERSDVYAQLLRVRLFAAAIGVLPLDNKKAAEEASIIAEFQVNGSNPTTTGGFYFGRKQGKPLPHVNPVSTAFAVQALEMWKRFESGDFVPDRNLLV